MSDNTVYAGDTISRTYTFTDTNGDVYDPDTITINILDPTGAIIDTLAKTDLTRASTGVYTMLYTLASDAVAGNWNIQVIATYAAQNLQTEEYFPFTVSATPAPAYCTTDQVSVWLQNRAFTSTSQPSDSQAAAFIALSDAFINGYCGHDYYEYDGVIEYQDGVSLGIKAGMILLQNSPVLTISKVEYYDGANWNTAVEGKPHDNPGFETYETYLSQGRIQFFSLAITGMKVYRVTYNYGYASVPTEISQLSAILTALKVLANLTGSTLQNYHTGDVGVAYPKDGQYGVQWEKLMFEAKQLMMSLPTRRPRASTG
jgi:hypothetical protein